MALTRVRRSESGFNYWPRFVDALSTLVLSIVFLLSVFLVVQLFQSEVFFDSGQATLLPEGQTELNSVANALTDLDKQIPGEIAWVLRVDGHTDVRPINSPVFKSNWELSSARAISVVQYLISLGVPAQRLVAAGFAEFQPLDTAANEDAYKRNRRIELKLTER